MLQVSLDEPTIAPPRRYRPLLSYCPIPGCGKLTMGGTCVEHDVPAATVFPRGRPYVRAAAADEVTLAPAA